MTKQDKIKAREMYANEAEKAANSGHYLERLYKLAVVFNDRDSEMAILALRQIYAYTGHKPQGADGIQYEISIRILIRAERDFLLNKKQLSKMWYGVHCNAHEPMGLKFPYGKGHGTNEMKSNTTWIGEE